MLILEIFAQRARSHEGKLQVELARLQYLSARGWCGAGRHLERQTRRRRRARRPGRKADRTRPPDDRRRASSAPASGSRRSSSSAARSAASASASGTFNISLVGYTNAGKSTLFNALVKARAYAADQLFATLDTTTRQLYLAMRARRPLGVAVRHGRASSATCRTSLIEAFQATLQEAADADLLLHVVDAANPTTRRADRRGAARAARDRRRRRAAGAGLQQARRADDTAAAAPCCSDVFELRGQRACRACSSARRTGEGLPELRRQLATRVDRARRRG